jgi:EAL domain-containing protein (putative c-di-GMP-specific phosphodiesterase class I)
MSNHSTDASAEMPGSLPKDDPHAAKRSCTDCEGGETLGFAFTYAYQPIVDLESRSIFAHEALVRGVGGEGAQSVLGRVDDANRYRFDQTCRTKAIKGAAALGMTERLSINFLPNAIYKPEACIRTTLAAARAYGFPLDRIIFEATEGDPVEDAARLANIFREYKRMGFLTAIDDFGAGYAGLTLLAEFQPDIVKIDMALVRGVDTSKSRQAITHGIMRTCNDLGVQVIAEGVETAEERDFFYSMGVRLMQGYLFSRPAFESLGTVDPASWPDQAQ